MDFIVKGPNAAIWGNREIHCAVGRNGFTSTEEKKEGDGKTPIGRWVMREVFYRPDKVKRTEIVTDLPVHALKPNDGWCDEINDPNYNRYVDLPYPKVGVPLSAERLWRDDDLYDIIVVLGYNDDPVVKGMGSAIFFHVTRENYAGTAGCIAVSREDLLTVLRDARAGAAVLIAPKP